MPALQHEPSTDRCQLLAIVPARKGSKGIPGKNKATIADRPLIDYTVAALEHAPSVDALLITTDDEEILGMYRGRPRIFLVERPPALATDTASTGDAVRHALEAWTGAGRPKPGALLLAQPTTPLRTSADVEEAFALFRASGAESLISACRAEGMRHPMDMYRMDADHRGSSFLDAGRGFHPRAAYEMLYQRNGAIYMVTFEYFSRTGRLRSEHPVIFEMPWERSVNIDVPGDLVIARALIESGLLSRPEAAPA